MNVAPFTLLLFCDQGDFPSPLLQFDRQVPPDAGLFQFLFLGNQGDFAGTLFLFASQSPLNLRPFQFGHLGDQADVAVPLLLLAGQGTLNFHRLAFFQFQVDGDLLGDPRFLQGKGLVDFLLFHQPALVQQIALLLGKGLGPLIGHFAFLMGGGKAFLLVHFQGGQAGFQAFPADAQGDVLSDLVPIQPPPLVAGRNGGDAFDLGLLLLLLFGDQFDFPVLFGFFQGQVLGDFDQFLFLGFFDQGDLARFFLQFQRQHLFHLGGFAALGLVGEVYVALGAQLFQGLGVFDFLAFHPEVLVEDIDLFFPQFQRLFIGNLHILGGAREGFLFFNV